MLIEVPEKVAKKIVVKRDGKKVEFDGAKIALAIQKGFGDIVGNEDPKTAKYNETDVNKVYSKVLVRIEKLDSDKIKIEEIQDLIEEELKNALIRGRILLSKSFLSNLLPEIQSDSRE